MAKTNQTPKIISRQEAKALGLKRYFTSKPCPKGHITLRYINGGCTECNHAHAAKFRTKLGTHGWSQYQIRRREEPSTRMTVLLQRAKHRAKTRSLIFEKELFKKYELNPPKTCECCGRDLDYALGKGHSGREFAPSIDRLNNQQGYTLANSRVICYRCNVLKKDGTLIEFQRIVAYMSSGSRIPK